MRYKIIIVLTTVLIASNTKLSAQTYYNPKYEINITLKIKEPFKPINYYEIGKNFNNMLQEEVAKREALKKYYDQIYFETKSSISTSTYLTDDNTLNQKILLLQNATFENLDLLNKQLKMGMIKPENYEMQLKSCYYNYINDNQIFLNLSRYKFIWLAENKNDSLINKFNNDFKIAMNSIISFSVDYNKTEYRAVGLTETISAEEKQNIKYLYRFITSACEGNLEQFKINWEKKNQNKEVAKFITDNPELLFYEMEGNYGVIKQNSNGRRIFVLKNNETIPIYILETTTNCGCVIAEWPKNAIPPGESYSINVLYNTSKIGQFTRTISVSTSISNQPIILTIKGEVVQ